MCHVSHPGNWTRPTGILRSMYINTLCVAPDGLARTQLEMADDIYNVGLLCAALHGNLWFIWLVVFSEISWWQFQLVCTRSIYLAIYLSI